MPNERDTEFGTLVGRLSTDADNPAPPPPMPIPRTHPVPPPPPVSTQPASAPSSAPAGQTAQEPSGGWSVDEDGFNAFADAIDRVRHALKAVNRRVELMGSASYTPTLGTSPVAEQLEKKFRDRLDAPLDDPQRPTTGGLRPMLAEATRRMEDFVAGAEQVLKSYQDQDSAGQQRFNTYGGGR